MSAQAAFINFRNTLDPGALKVRPNEFEALKLVPMVALGANARSSFGGMKNKKNGPGSMFPILLPRNRRTTSHPQMLRVTLRWLATDLSFFILTESVGFGYQSDSPMDRSPHSTNLGNRQSAIPFIQANRPTRRPWRSAVLIISTLLLPIHVSHSC